MTAPQAPAEFREVQAAEPTGVRVDRDALTRGVVVQYRGMRRFAKQGGGTTTVQVFIARGGQGKRFSTFGTAQLDSKLSHVKPGSIVWLQYNGKSEIEGNATHSWTVSDAGGRLDAVKLAEILKNSEREHVALDQAIEAAERERAATGQANDASYFDSMPRGSDEVPF